MSLRGFGTDSPPAPRCARPPRQPPTRAALRRPLALALTLMRTLADLRREFPDKPKLLPQGTQVPGHVHSVGHGSRGNYFVALRGGELIEVVEHALR